jgi:hypothetical protein
MNRYEIEKLKNEGLDSFKWRGHHPGKWDCSFDMEHFKWDCSFDMEHFYMNCTVCGKQLHVNLYPLPNEIDISGEAVALSCED